MCVCESVSSRGVSSSLIPEMLFIFFIAAPGAMPLSSVSGSQRDIFDEGMQNSSDVMKFVKNMN